MCKISGGGNSGGGAKNKSPALMKLIKNGIIQIKQNFCISSAGYPGSGSAYCSGNCVDLDMLYRDNDFNGNGEEMVEGPLLSDTEFQEKVKNNNCSNASPSAGKFDCNGKLDGCYNKVLNQPYDKTWTCNICTNVPTAAYCYKNKQVSDCKNLINIEFENALQIHINIT